MTRNRKSESPHTKYLSEKKNHPSFHRSKTAFTLKTTSFFINNVILPEEGTREVLRESAGSSIGEKDDL
jgi:hypothetical protein